MSADPRPPAVGSVAATTGLAVALVLLAVVVYLPTLDAGFVDFDDPQWVAANPRVHSGWGLDGVAWALRANVLGHWAPLTVLSHVAAWRLFAADPAGHHLVNLLLHAASALLLFRALVAATGAAGRSAVVAALFAAHPQHVESVAWISERKDVLSAFFWMLGLLAYARYVRRPSPARYLAVAAALAVGLAAKAIVVVLPIVLLLLDAWPFRRAPLDAGARRDWARLALEKAPLLALSAASGVVTLVAVRALVAPSAVAPLGLRLANALASYGAYLRHAVWPTGLAVFYPFPSEPPLAAALVSGVLLVAVTVAAWRLRRAAPYLLVGWLWFLVTLLPVSGIVQAGALARGDRYMYLPAIGLYLMIVWGIAELAAARPALRRALPVVALFVVAALAAAARAQTAYWSDSETLYRRALAVTDDNYLAHLNLAETLRERGEREEALAHYLAAARSRPELAATRAALGSALRAWGRLADALPELAAAAALERDSRIETALAATLDDLGRPAEAEAHLRRALAIAPDFVDAHHGLGVLLERRGADAEALAHYRRALALDPGRTELLAAAARLERESGPPGSR